MPHNEEIRNFILEAEALSPDKNRTLLRKGIIKDLRITRQAYDQMIKKGVPPSPKKLDKFRRALNAPSSKFYVLAIEHFISLGEKRGRGRPRKQAQ